LEVLALRQQVAVLKRKCRRPVLSRLDRIFWIMLRSVWPRWSDVVAIVKPATVIAWHRKGFRLYWRWRSRRPGGRPRITEKVRNLIGKMRLEIANWGAPKIHGELVSSASTSPSARSPGISESGAPEARSLISPGSISCQSSRGNRRVRFLHCGHIDVQTAVLLPGH